MEQSFSLQFNLVDEPWIPVVDKAGVSRTLSLREMFTQAPAIATISGEIPIMNIALIRLALAILYATYREVGAEPGITDDDLARAWMDLYRSGAFPEGDIDSYLDEHLEAFDLFGNHPFYQVAGLEYQAKGPDPVSELIIDMPKPGKTLFTMRAPQSLTQLSFAEAARYLVLEQAYSPAGIKSPVVGYVGAKGGKAYAPKGALGTGWCGGIEGVFLEGDTLFETLLLNWPLIAQGRHLLGVSGDTAPWERENASAASIERNPVGPIDVLTWQSRRIRLIPNERGTAVSGVILCYGDVSSPVDKRGVELMTGWRRSLPQQKKLGTAHVPLMPRQVDPSRALWRGLPSLLSKVATLDKASTEDLRSEVIRWIDYLQLNYKDTPVQSHLIRIHVQGLSYGTQSSVVEDMVDDYLDLDSSMVDADSSAVKSSVEVVKQADDAVSALVKFVHNVEKANGNDRPQDERDIREHAYDMLDRVFRSRLAGFTPDQDRLAYCNAWREEIRCVVERMARDYLESSGLSAFREAGTMTSGRAISIFKLGITRVLGEINYEPANQVSTKGGHDGLATF